MKNTKKTLTPFVILFQIVIFKYQKLETNPMSKRKSFTEAAKKPGYSAKGDKLYYKGDLVGKEG